MKDPEIELMFIRAEYRRLSQSRAFEVRRGNARRAGIISRKLAWYRRRAIAAFEQSVNAKSATA